MSDNNEKLNKKEFLQFVQFLYTKQSALRDRVMQISKSQIATVSIVMSVYLFYFNRVISEFNNVKNDTVYWITVGLATLGFILLIVVAIQSIGVITHLKKRSREYLKDAPDRLFFHSRETLNKFPLWEQYYNAITNASLDDLAKSLLSEVRGLDYDIANNFNKLRNVSKLFIVTMIIVLISFTLLMLNIK